ncbi:MAG: FHA domain-containing protein [Myxococcota bacterium]
MLRNWLHHPPSPVYVRRGQQVLLALCRHGASSDAFGGREGLTDVIDLAKDVAQAAGGFFGMGAVAATEAEAIDAIAAALDIHHDRPWSEPDDTTIIPADADTEGDGPSPQVLFPDADPAQSSRGTLVQYDDLRGEQSCPVGPKGVTIGRNRDNDVQITYDAQVSRQHCRLYQREDRFYVQDLGSTRGTWVNGERVLERRLLGGETPTSATPPSSSSCRPRTPPSNYQRPCTPLDHRVGVARVGSPRPRAGATAAPRTASGPPPAGCRRAARCARRR